MSKETIIYQSAPASLIQDTVSVEGVVAASELKRHGCFGIGSPHLLEGEIVLLDDILYYVDPDGEVSISSDGRKLAFGVVVNQLSNDPIISNQSLTYDELQTFLSEHIDNKNQPCAIRCEGLFEEVLVRSLLRHDGSEFDLSDMRENKFLKKNIEGTMVGFYVPEYLNKLAPPGFHFHFIDKERQFAGHLHHAAPKNVAITIQPATKHIVDYNYLPKDID